MKTISEHMADRAAERRAQILRRFATGIAIIAVCTLVAQIGLKAALNTRAVANMTPAQIEAATARE